MKVLIDTSLIVDIDRQKKETVELFKKLAVDGTTEMVISAVTVSEILTGAYLKKDVKTSVLTAKEILNQFIWISLDGEVAEKTGQLLAYLLAEKKEIGYQDTAIAASFLVSRSDYLLTLNKKDFVVFPALKDKVFSPEEFIRKML